MWDDPESLRWSKYQPDIVLDRLVCWMDEHLLTVRW